MTDNGPQRVSHVHQVLVGTVQGELTVRRIALIEVARKALTHFIETTLVIIPGRIVQVVDSCNALLVGLVVVPCVIAVLIGSIEEVLARSHGQRNECQSNDIFNLE